MLGSAVFRTGVAPGGALAGPWVRNPLWTAARAVPSLDLRFADNKNLVDATTGQNLVTFTRASSGTYVDSQGVIRTATTNLLLRSEEFDNASWTKSGASITANNAIAPNGLPTADQLVEDISNGGHLALQSITVTNATTYTFSVYLKKSGRRYAGIVFSAAAATLSVVGVDFDAGQIVQISGLTNATGTITSVGNGWFRVSATTTSIATGAFDCNVRPFAGTTWNERNYTGDGTSGIYLWGAQLEQSSTVGEYIPTTSTINSAPRFDHNPTTGESLGLLVEEQRTNSIRNNTMVGTVAGTPGTLPTNWIGAGSSGLAREVVGTGTESGIAYVDVRYFGTTTSALFQAVGFEVTNQIAATQSSIWTSTAFVKLAGGSLTNITSARLVIDNYNSSSVSLGQYAIGNFVPTTAALITQRYSVSSTSSTFSNAATAFVRPYLQFEANSGVAIDITLRIGLPQLEQGAFATSVIPASGTAATRSADVASITGSNFSSWYRQDAQTWFGEYAPVYNASATVPVSTLHLMQVYNLAMGANNYAIRGANNSVNQEFVARNPTAGAQFPNNSGIGFGVAGTNRKVSFGIDSSTLNISTNGAINSVANNAAALMATHDILSIGGGTGGSPPYALNGTIRRLTYWPQRLPNSTLQQITQ